MVEMLRSGWLSIVRSISSYTAKKKDKESRQESTARTFEYTNNVAARISIFCCNEQCIKGKGNE